jgi:hypothetical protein
MLILPLTNPPAAISQADILPEESVARSNTLAKLPEPGPGEVGLASVTVFIPSVIENAMGVTVVRFDWVPRLAGKGFAKTNIAVIPQTPGQLNPSNNVYGVPVYV